MRIAIVGSRGFHHLHKVRSYVSTIPKGATVVSGSNAIGVNECALAESRKSGLKTLAIAPDFKKNGKQTSIQHMREILGNSDHVVVFWDGKSTGSKLFIDMARRAGKSIQIIR
jgi:predicted Rossmann fold nucleotide-binding protein DprA/Smf involved in DNA uptake